MDFDELLFKRLKPFGRYQKCVVGVFGFYWFVSTFHIMGVAFIAATPRHHCKTHNTTLDGASNYTKIFQNTELESADKSNSQCTIEGDYGVNSTSKTVNCEDFVYDTSQYQNTLVMQLDLVCSDTYKTGFLNTAYIIGGAISSVFCSRLTDLVGRRPVFIVSCILSVGCSFVVAMVNEYYLFVVVWCLISIFENACSDVSYVLGLELVGPSYRSLVSTIFMLSWAAGYMFVAVLAYAIRDHIHLLIAMAGLQALSLLTLWLVPESPRWLLTKGRTDDAHALCRKMGRFNQVALTDPIEIKCEDDKDKPASAIEMFRTKYTRRNTLILFFGWMSATFVYYGLSWNPSAFGGNEYLNFLLAGGAEVPAYLFNLVALDKFGRRPIASLSMITSGLLLVSTLLLPAGLFVVKAIVLVITKCSITCVYSMLYQYTTELYPTNIRATAFGWNSVFAQIGSLVASQILLLGEVKPSLPTLLLGVFPIVSGVLFMFTPETNGRPLPQTIEDVENEGLRGNTFTCCHKTIKLPISLSTMEQNERSEGFIEEKVTFDVT